MDVVREQARAETLEDIKKIVQLMYNNESHSCPIPGVHPCDIPCVLALIDRLSTPQEPKPSEKKQ